MGSGFGTVDSAVTSDTRWPKFESSHQQLFSTRKDKMKKKRPGMAQLFKKSPLKDTYLRLGHYYQHCFGICLWIIFGLFFGAFFFSIRRATNYCSTAHWTVKNESMASMRITNFRIPSWIMQRWNNALCLDIASHVIKFNQYESFIVMLCYDFFMTLAPWHGYSKKIILPNAFFGKNLKVEIFKMDDAQPQIVNSRRHIIGNKSITFPWVFTQY